MCICVYACMSVRVCVCVYVCVCVRVLAGHILSISISIQCLYNGVDVFVSCIFIYIIMISNTHKKYLFICKLKMRSFFNSDLYIMYTL